MGLDILRLYGQGRAKAPNQLWSPEENDFVHLLCKERGLNRPVAADFVRNGVMTLEDYDQATAQAFKPKKLDDVVNDAIEELGDEGKKALKGKKK